MSLKNSNDAIGNQTHDLPACSAVPQATAPPGNPKNRKREIKFQLLYWGEIHFEQIILVRLRF